MASRIIPAIFLSMLIAAASTARGAEFSVNTTARKTTASPSIRRPSMPSRVAGIEMKWPPALINVYEQSDVTISREGATDGNGKMWWGKYRKMRSEDYGPSGIRRALDYDCPQPRLIRIYQWTNVNLSGLTLKRNIAISDITATGARNAFSVDSYEDSYLSHVIFHTFDVESKVAGSISNAYNRTFTNTHIKSADGSSVTVKIQTKSLDSRPK